MINESNVNGSEVFARISAEGNPPIAPGIRTITLSPGRNEKGVERSYKVPDELVTRGNVSVRVPNCVVIALPASKNVTCGILRRILQFDTRIRPNSSIWNRTQVADKELTVWARHVRAAACGESALLDEAPGQLIVRHIECAFAAGDEGRRTQSINTRAADLRRSGILTEGVRG